METFKQTFKNWSKFESAKIYKLNEKLESDGDVLRLGFNRYNTLVTDIDKYLVAECPLDLYTEPGPFSADKIYRTDLYLIKDTEGMAFIGDYETVRKAQKEAGLKLLDDAMEYLESLTD